MTIFINRHKYPLLGGALFFILGAVLGLILNFPAAAPYAALPTAQLTTFTENNVRVTLALASEANGQPVLVARFEPLEDGYYFYSKDLPATGVRGLGRPTLLELSPQSVLKPRGPLVASQAAHADFLEGLADPLLVYPVGPVSLYLPIALPTALPLTEEVLISYMTCSVRGQCMAPVAQKPVPITLTAE